MNEREKVNLLGPVWRWLLTVALVAGLVLLFSAPGGAQSTPGKTTPSSAKVVAPPSEKPSSAKAAQSPANGKTEGIKVHGHWMIEVRNPDGTVVTRREFENSLQPSGPVFLGSILGRQNTVGGWVLQVTSSVAPVCLSLPPTVQPSTCTIGETGSGLGTTTNTFPTMHVSVGATGSLVLTGTLTAAQSGTIDLVTSQAGVCSPGTAPTACFAHETNSFFFTIANVTPGVNVSFGQTVALTVTFTFA